MKVLIVDNNPNLVQRITAIVQEAGGEVFATAATEDEAANRFTADVDVLVTELSLAQGTGFGLMRRGRALERARPACLIVLTNHVQASLKVASFEAGADYFLAKDRDFGLLPRLLAQQRDLLKAAA